MTDNAENPRWRGINHLALVTNDMDATVRFYHGVLGMRLVTTLKAGPMRHYFFETAPGNTVAFFEVKRSQPFTAPAGLPDKRKAQFDHLSFNLADEESLHDLQRRLKEAGCEVTDVVDHGVVRSIYFNDNNGIALEASWWVHDATAHESNFSDDRFFVDPEPVPALRELQGSGRLEWLPETTLTADNVVDPV